MGELIFSCRDNCLLFCSRPLERPAPSSSGLDSTSPRRQELSVQGFNGLCGSPLLQTLLCLNGRTAWENYNRLREDVCIKHHKVINMQVPIMFWLGPRSCAHSVLLHLVSEARTAVHCQIHLTVWYRQLPGRWYRSYNYTCPKNIHPKGDQTPMLHADASRCTAGTLLYTPTIYYVQTPRKVPFPRFPIKPSHQISKQRCTQAVYTSHSIVCTMPISRKERRSASPWQMKSKNKIK